MSRYAHHLGLAVIVCGLGFVFCTGSTVAAKVLCESWTGYVKVREENCKSWETEIPLAPPTWARSATNSLAQQMVPHQLTFLIGLAVTEDASYLASWKVSAQPIFGPAIIECALRNNGIELIGTQTAETIDDSFASTMHDTTLIANIPANTNVELFCESDSDTVVTLAQLTLLLVNDAAVMIIP